MDYPVEEFTPDERRLLEPHFTNLDLPVFCVVNLPEVVKGALFARYSRYGGTLRRLYLDEFAGEVPVDVSGDAGSERAERLYERVFLEFGDDSVAQLGGAHLAVEWSSNILTKILQRGRLAAYLEQSTRYIAYDARLPGGRYRYYRDERLGPSYDEAMERIFDLYSTGLTRLREWCGEAYPRGDEPESGMGALDQGEGARRDAGAAARRVAQPCGHLRLGAGLRAARHAAAGVAAARGARGRRDGAHRVAQGDPGVPEARRHARPGRRLDRVPGAAAGARPPSPPGGSAFWTTGEEPAAVQLLRADGSEEDLIAACLFEASDLPEEQLREAAARLEPDERARLIADLTGERANRRHKPGRGFEALRYRFEIVSDYGAFRDLQRHRLLTAQWQRLGCDLGADVPEEVEAAGYGDAYREGLEVSRAEHDRLRSEGLVEEASYAVSLAYRIRYVLDMNAREAMHLIELRSGREGHPTYRAVALEMLDAIAEVHPSVAAAMTYVDRETESRLERLQGEMRRHRRLQAAGRS